MEGGYQHVERGDLVISGMNAHLGGLGIADSDGKCTPVYIVLEPVVECDPRFISRVLWHAAQAGYVGSLVNAVRYNSSDFRPDTVKSIFVPVPPLDEQRRIADFLDNQVARIDGLLAARSLQVDLRRTEGRNAIEAAVLDLGARNGSLPLRRWVFRIEQGWSPQCDSQPAETGEWGVLKVGAVRAGSFRSDQNKRLPDELQPLREYEVKAGDLLFSRANTPTLVGEAAVVPVDVRPMLILCDKLFRVDLRQGVNAAFVRAVAGTTRARWHFSALSSGTSGSMVNIRAEDIQSLSMPIASTQEQAELAAEADLEHVATSNALGALDRSIALLREYKRSLITAAVTGEFDVSAASGRGVPA
jgi:type I restriction enzyme S subunit